ncbi:hypothetical protein GPJ56_007186 [Histomonas meleagridis]|uniref:uncharacterized protein n=1 Tax=Histomonas meleagridis TaxID=135588 RepID=UPI00355937FF|nr:hypothetical protein GPJ56_007186 [Histomonas meleagridis]KAH0800110.1 hypothetical protein GO595_007222 [Histomonas meleagridis]
MIDAENNGKPAQIVHCFPADNKALVKFQPNIDYDRLNNLHLKSQSQLYLKLPPNYRAPLTFFDESKLNEIGAQITNELIELEKGVYLPVKEWDGKRFYGKFQIKFLPYSELLNTNLKFTQKEINIFQNNVFGFEQKIEQFNDYSKYCIELKNISYNTKHVFENGENNDLRQHLEEKEINNEMQMNSNTENNNYTRNSIGNNINNKEINNNSKTIQNEANNNTTDHIEAKANSNNNNNNGTTHRTETKANSNSTAHHTEKKLNSNEGNNRKNRTEKTNNSNNNNNNNNSASHRAEKKANEGDNNAKKHTKHKQSGKSVIQVFSNDFIYEPRVGDLVHTQGGSYGVVTQKYILTTAGLRIPIENVQSLVLDDTNAVDSNGRRVNIGEIVLVLNSDEQYNGQKGTVLHIFLKTFFVKVGNDIIALNSNQVEKESKLPSDIIGELVVKISMEKINETKYRIEKMNIDGTIEVRGPKGTSLIRCEDIGKKWNFACNVGV